MYIVKLLAKDGNEDCQFVNVEVNCNNEEIAINKAVDFYYEKYWTNTEWRKEDFENEMIKIKSKIELLSKDLSTHFTSYSKSFLRPSFSRRCPVHFSIVLCSLLI